MPILHLTINDTRNVLKLSARGDELELDAERSRLVWRSQSGVSRPVEIDAIDERIHRCLAAFAGHAREVPLVVSFDPRAPQPQRAAKVAVFPAGQWPTIGVA